MALSIKIDFNNSYEIDTISNNLKTITFHSEVTDGRSIPLKIEISNDAHELLPNVYNLAFGPTDEKGRIDDKARLAHKDYSRVFSTILLSGLTYLTSNKGHYLGVDGSDNARAYLYYLFLQRNYLYLNQYFNLFGLKYYVRITRFGKTQYDNPFNFDDINPKPERIQKETRMPASYMYNYFIFNLK